MYGNKEKYTSSFDTSHINNYYQKAISLKNENNDSSVYYFLKTFQSTLPILNKYHDKKYEFILFSSIQNVCQFFKEKGQQTTFANIIVKLFPYLKNHAVKVMLFKLLIDSDYNFLKTKKNVSLLVSLIDELKLNNKHNELAKIFLFIGNYFYGNLNFEKSLQYYQLSYDFFKKSKDEIGLSKVLNNFSIIHIELKNYKEAEKNLLESLNFKEKLKDELGKSSVYNNLSMIYSDLALSYLNKKQDSAIFYKDKALYYYELSRQIDSIYNNTQGVMTTLLNEASLLTDFEEFSKAQKKYAIIKKYTEKNPYDIEIVLYYLINSSDLDVQIAEKASLSRAQKEEYLKIARKKILKAYNICKSNGIDIYFKDIYSQLYSINKLLGNNKEALTYYELHQAYKDSLYNIEKINYVNLLDKKFQTKQQKEMIVFLEKEKQWLNNQRKLILLFGSLLLFLSIVVIYQIYKRLTITRKQSQIIETQKNKIEQIHNELIKKNNLIQQSIEYTQSIQESFLIEEKELKKYFKDAFIIYLPKEKLSGDFYFFKELNGLYYIALGDCAGHSIPGAVMSLVATTLLMQTLSSEISETSEILKHLHCKLLEVQSQRNQSITESTELSICCIDPINKNISVSSTNQEVYLMLDKQFVLVEPDIQSLGQVIDLNHNNEVFFNTHKFSYQDECIIIMSSDGIYDEYNYAIKKRYGKKQFKEFLEKRIQKPLYHIKEDIIIEHSKWNNQKNQIDDITILGVKL